MGTIAYGLCTLRWNIFVVFYYHTHDDIRSVKNTLESASHGAKGGKKNESPSYQEFLDPGNLHNGEVEASY